MRCTAWTWPDDLRERTLAADKRSQEVKRQIRHQYNGRNIYVMSA